VIRWLLDVPPATTIDPKETTIMKVRVLGTGCPKCKKLYAEAEKAVAASGVAVELEKVEKIDEIMNYNVMMMPALVIEQDVKASGRIPSVTEIVTWITTAAGKTE